MKHENLVAFDVGTVTDAGDHEGTGFPKPPHRVPVAIAFLHAEIGAGGAQEACKLVELRSGGKAVERELLKGFIDHVEARRPRLASFNGRALVRRDDQVERVASIKMRMALACDAGRA